MADDATKTDSPNRVYAKWGFGDAPLKRKHREQFEAAIKSLLSLIAEQEFNASQLGNISIVKGLFSRSWKQDQWDWATVWRLLGRPSTNTSTHISHNLAELRRNIQTGDSASCSRVIQELRNAGIERLLKKFLGRTWWPKNWGRGFRIHLCSVHERAASFFENRFYQSRCRRASQGDQFCHWRDFPVWD